MFYSVVNVSMLWLTYAVMWRISDVFDVQSNYTNVFHCVEPAVLMAVDCNISTLLLQWAERWGLCLDINVYVSAVFGWSCLCRTVDSVCLCSWAMLWLNC